MRFGIGDKTAKARRTQRK